MAFRSDGDMKAGDKVTLSQAGIDAGVLRVRQVRGKVRGTVIYVNNRRGTITVMIDGAKRALPFVATLWEKA
jgi:hypothetical protein